MGKAIELTRRELVWETYATRWDETDWANTLEWLSKRNDQYSKEIYDLIKNLSWDEIVAEWERWQGRSDEDCLYYIYHTSHNYNPATGNYDGEEYTWKEPLWDILREWMQEEMWDNGPEGSDYADDYDEEWYLNGEQE